MSENPGPAQGQGAGLPSDWTAFIEPFAQAIGKDVESVTSGLKGLVGEAGASAIELLRSPEYTSDDDLKSAVGDKVPTAVFRKAVAAHLRKAAPAGNGAADAQPAARITSLEVLPSVPDDASWLDQLRTGGILKVDKPQVIAAIRAALASRSGLYELPTQLVERMEAHAEQLEEPVGSDFFKLRKLLTRRNYAEIFEALEVDGTFVSQARKTAFIKRLDTMLWPALLSFDGQLRSWAQAWQQSFGNPAAMMGVLATLAGGGGALPPGMTDPPPTDSLRDAAAGVNDQINRIFAGLGIPVAMALAYDAQRIKEVLENPMLPAQVGAANREQMLKMLGVSVSADYVRLERNVARYALAIMEYQTVGSGQEELGYLQALLMLGSQIPFDKLGVPARRTPVLTGTR